MALRRAKKKRTISPEMREAIRNLTLMNNSFMNIVLENNPACVEEILRVILKKDDLHVISVQTQRMFQGFGRSIYLDVLADDSEGVLYNIEIQQSDEGADPRRARFHTGMIDTHKLKAGQDFKELPELYVIFITQNDVLGLKRTIYTIHKYIDEVMKPFDDGSHLIYINGSAEDDGSEIWKLIHDFHCTKAEEMYFPRLAERVGYLKDNEEGVSTMSDYFAEREAKAVKAAEEKAEKRGERKARKKYEQEKESSVLRLIGSGKLTLEEIAACCGLTLKRVQTLAAGLR